MSTGPRNHLDQAITSIQAGDLETGKRFLANILKREPDNVDAWLWLATAVDNLEQRTECLRRVLSISPHNKIAWQRLAALTSASPRRDRSALAGYEGLEFKCSRCGGEKHFHIGQQSLVCSQCGNVEGIEQPEMKIPISQRENPVHVMLSSRQAQAELGGHLAVTCRRCGSTTTWSARHGTVECPFCGTDVVLKASAEFPTILPQGIIPFQIDQKQAREAVQTWWGRVWFRPPRLPSRSSILRLRGVYVPFWTFDHLYRVQWFEEEDGGRGFNSKRMREHLTMFDDVLVCGSYTLSDKIARGLEPFTTKELVLCQAAYLAGWPAEVTQLSMADASIRARERMVKETRDQFPVGATVQEVSTEYMTYKHILLPVWVGEYIYKGRSYHFAVNGQTGKVSGIPPRSLALLFDGIAALAFLLPFAVLGFVLFGPKLPGEHLMVIGAMVMWFLVLVLYAMAWLFNWRDLDISKAVEEIPDQIKDKTLSAKNQKAVAQMVDELSEQMETANVRNTTKQNHP